MSDNENQVNNVINELKKVQNVEDILAFMVRYMGNDKLRECINGISDSSVSSVSESVSVKPKKRKAMKMLKSKNSLNELGYVEKVVSGDGNCQFRSIAVLLGKKSEEWRSVKKDMLKCLKENLDKMVEKPVQEEKVLLEEAKMILKTDGEWGNQLTLSIAENCFGININIYNAQIDNFIMSDKNNDKSGFVVWDGEGNYGHYNPAVKEETLVEVKTNICEKVANSLSNTYCALLACDKSKEQFIVASYSSSNGWKLRKNGKWLSFKDATNEKVCTKLPLGKTPKNPLTVEEAIKLLNDNKIPSKFHTLMTVGNQWGKDLSNSFGLNIQRDAAKKNLYIVGARKGKLGSKFLTYKFDSKKKDWLRKNKKPYATWMSVSSIKNTKNSFSGKLSKKTVDNFMSLDKLYLDSKQFNFGKDIQFGPLKPSSFGVMKYQRNKRV